MVAPGLLQNPEVRRWLNGIEPAWTMLEFDSFIALHDEPSASNPAIRLEPKLAEAEMSGSAIVANALILLRRAADTDGLKLTATGNLSRAAVEEMCGIMEWPGYDKDELFGFHKVINEPDFLPLHFIRILTQAGKLLRKYRGKLVVTPLGNGHPHRDCTRSPRRSHPVIPLCEADQCRHLGMRRTKPYGVGVSPSWAAPPNNRKGPMRALPRNSNRGSGWPRSGPYQYWASISDRRQNKSQGSRRRQRRRTGRRRRRLRISGASSWSRRFGPIGAFRNRKNGLRANAAGMWLFYRRR
jgi:hypothetical protein